MAYGDDTATVDPSRQDDIPSLDLPGAVQGMTPPQQIARIPDPQTMPPERQVRQPPQQRPMEPPPFRAPYQAASPRGYSQWGQDWWPLQSGQFYPGTEMPPGLPSGREALGIIQGAGAQLGQWGPPGVSQPAMQASGLAGMLQRMSPILDLYSKGAFSKNMLAAQQGRLRLMEEQMALKAEQAADESKRQMVEWARIFGTWSEGGFGKGAEGDARAEDAARQFALATGHQELLGILQNGGMNAAEAYLEYIDSKTRDLAAGAAATRKGSKTEANDPFTDQGGREGAGGLPHREEERLQKLDVQTGRAAPPATPPIQTGDVQSYIQKQYNGADIAAQIKKNTGVNDGGMQAARNELAGIPIEKGYAGTPNAIRAANELRGRIGQAIQDPNLQTPDDKFAAVGAIDASSGAIAKSVFDYKTDIDRVPVAGGARQFIRGIVKTIDPNFDEGNFASVHRFMNQDSKEFSILARASEATQGITNVLRAINRTKENTPIPRRVIDAWLAGHISGDDQYDDIYNSLLGMGQQFNAVLSLTGTPRVTLVHDLLAHLPRTASPRDIRRQMLNDASDIWQLVDHYQYDWEHVTRRKTLNPGIQPTTWDFFSAFVRSNPSTGEMPSDAPPMLRSLSRNPREASSRVPQEERWKPLRADQLRQLEHLIRDKEHSHDPDVQAQVQELIKLLPKTINPGIDRPPED